MDGLLIPSTQGERERDRRLLSRPLSSLANIYQGGRVAKNPFHIIFQTKNKEKQCLYSQERIYYIIFRIYICIYFSTFFECGNPVQTVCLFHPPLFLLLPRSKEALMEAPASAAVEGKSSYHNGREERRERGGNYRANKALAASAREKEGGERAFWLGGDLPPPPFPPEINNARGEKSY